MVVTLSAAVLGLLIFDLYLLLRYGREGTISNGVYLWGLDHPWLPWVFIVSWVAVGLFLAWHWWWG